MTDIKDTAERLFFKFSRVAGIYQFGSNGIDTIKVGVADPETQEFKDVLPDIEKEAAPYKIEIEKGEAPRLC